MTRIRAAALGAATVLVVAGGCSGDPKPTEQNKSPAEIVADAQRALGSAKTVHLRGDISSSGQKITLDIRIKGSEGGVGSVTTSGAKFDVVRVGSSVYVRGDAAAYRKVSGDAAAKLLGGKWLKAPASGGSFGPFAQFTDIKELQKVLTPEGTPTKTGLVKIHGTDAVGVKDGADGGVLYVQASGTPYPLQIRREASSNGAGAGGGSGTVDFLDYDEPVNLAVPKDAVDINQLR